jgi:hypothetical protein
VTWFPALIRMRFGVRQFGHNAGSGRCGVMVVLVRNAARAARGQVCFVNNHVRVSHFIYISKCFRRRSEHEVPGGVDQPVSSPLWVPVSQGLCPFGSEKKKTQIAQAATAMAAIEKVSFMVIESLLGFGLISFRGAQTKIGNFCSGKQIKKFAARAFWTLGILLGE